MKQPGCRRLGLCALAAIFAAFAQPTEAMRILSEESARSAAIGALLGKPYGWTFDDVSRVVAAGRFVEADAKRMCAGNGAPVWEFPVSTTHEGMSLRGVIQINARTGKLDCANLPFLD